MELIKEVLNDVSGNIPPTMYILMGAIQATVSSYILYIICGLVIGGISSGSLAKVIGGGIMLWFIGGTLLVLAVVGVLMVIYGVFTLVR